VVYFAPRYLCLVLHSEEDRSIFLARTRDLVTYRDLLRNLVVRDLKVRYRGSFIGFLWSLLNPLLMMGVYWFVFTKLLKSDKPEFHIFVFVALLPWNWCASSVLGAITSIVGNAHLIKKVYFPRELLPLSVVIANGINYLFALPVLFLLIALAGEGPELRSMEDHTQPVTSVAFAPDAQMLASASDDGTVRLWRTRDGTALPVLNSHSGRIHTVAFAPDGQMVAAGGDDSNVRLWNASNGALVRVIEARNRGVTSVTFAPDGKTLAVAGVDGSVRLWSALDGALVRALGPARKVIWATAYSPDGQLLAGTGDDARVHLWRVADGAELQTLAGATQPLASVAFARDGQTVAAGSVDGTVRFWRVAGGTLLRTLNAHSGAVYSLAFAPDGSSLATAGEDHKVRLWRVDDGSAIRSMDGHNGKVNSVAFSPDGQTLVSGSDDHTVRLWTAGGGTSMHFSPYIGWIPLLIVTQAIFLAGVSFLFAALNVFFRDTQAIMEVGIQAWFFLTPVIYSAEDVLPKFAYWMYWLNPMASIISSYRIILYNNGLSSPLVPAGLGPDPAFMFRTLLTSVVVLVFGYLFFRSLSNRFGEEL
jgi:WD40 repeat protein